MTIRACVLLVVLSGAVFAQDEETGKEGGKPTEPATEEGLRAVMEELVKAKKEGDTATITRISQRLYREEGVKKSFVDDCPPEIYTRYREFLARYVPDDPRAPEWAELFGHSAENTELLIYAATTEQLKEKAKESREFPGGAIQAAQAGVLRPKLTFYEVNFVKPGKRSGTSYPLFFHDGDCWRFLGKIWRALP